MRKTLKYLAFYTSLTLIGVVFLAPYVPAVFGALKPPADLFASSPWSPCSTSRHLEAIGSIQLED